MALLAIQANIPLGIKKGAVLNDLVFGLPKVLIQIQLGTSGLIFSIIVLNSGGCVVNQIQV